MAAAVAADKLQPLVLRLIPRQQLPLVVLVRGATTELVILLEVEALEALLQLLVARQQSRLSAVVVRVGVKVRGITLHLELDLPVAVRGILTNNL